MNAVISSCTSLKPLRIATSLILLVSLGCFSAASGKDSDSHLLKKARELVNKKKNVEAQAVFEQVLKRNPKNAEAHAGLAWTLFTQGQRDQAEEHAKKSLEIDNKIPMAHNVMGAIYFSKGMVEEAKNEFRTVLKLDPKRRCGGCGDLRGFLGANVPASQNTTSKAK